MDDYPITITFMKKILLAVLLLVLCLPVQAQPNYANTNTQQTLSRLPTTLVNPDGSITHNPTTNLIVGAGWRWVTYVQPPSNGYAMSGNYWVTSTNQTYGTCSLWITNQYNTSQSADAIITNSPLWTSAFVANCKTFRSTLRLFGTTETNAVVNSETMSTWLGVYAQTNTISPQLTAQLVFMGQMYPQLLNFAPTTATFPWRLIP